MPYFLAQEDQTQIVEVAQRFDPARWAVDSSLIVTGLSVALAILVVGGIVLAISRRTLGRVRLTGAFLVLVTAAAIYVGFGLMKPQERLAFWLSRAFCAAMIFVIFRAIDRLALIPLMTRGGRIPLQRFVHQIIVIIAGIFVVLGFGSVAFGWDIDKFLAGSAVVSIVLGLALQESLGNFFSGLVMHASNPFAIGDWIVVGEVEGRVVDMNWRAVTIETDDDNFVIVPNAKIAGEVITNFNAPTRATARSVFVGLDYEIPPSDAIELLRATAMETPRVLHEPRPRIFLVEYADSSINYRIEFWIEDMPNHLEIEQDVRANLWYRLKQKGYGIPFPIRTVEHVSMRHKTAAGAEAGVQQRLRAIASVALLTPLSEEQRRSLAGVASTVHLGSGQTLFHQGDAGDSFYVIEKGEVEVIIQTDTGAARTIATLGKGDFFGEMSALTGQPRTATIRAKSGLRLVEIGKDDLQGLFNADPSIMEKLSQIIAQRNAERAALSQGGADTSAEAVVQQQQSLFQRMRSFFGFAGRG